MTEDNQKQTLGLSTAQVAGSALAAITTAVVASWAGTAGTLIGAALGSVVATVGTATYTWSIKRTSAVVRRSAGQVPLARVRQERPPGWWKALPWGRLGVASVLAAVVALAGITVVEAVGGKPVSSYTGGSSSTGTTLGHVTGSDPAPARRTPSPEPSPTPTPTPSSTPSESPSPAPTPTPEPSPTQVPSVPLPTQEPTAEPTTP